MLCGVSRQPPRVFIQKMAAVTHCGPSVVALRNRNSATLAVALIWPVSSSYPVVLAERLRIDGKNTGNVRLGDAEAGHGLDLTAVERIRSVRSASQGR